MDINYLLFLQNLRSYLGGVNDPLIILDGIPIVSNLGNINPNNIERIDV